jgi:hypothetical protein
MYREVLLPKERYTRFFEIVYAVIYPLCATVLDLLVGLFIGYSGRVSHAPFHGSLSEDDIASQEHVATDG